MMNSAALIKQERQDNLRKATRTIAKRVEKWIEVDGGVFEHLFEMLQFIEIIYINRKCDQCHLSFLHTLCKAFYA
jgi:hypothetical protein